MDEWPEINLADMTWTHPRISFDCPNLRVYVGPDDIVFVDDGLKEVSSHGYARVDPEWPISLDHLI